ncbi:MAG: Gfo/Idh/MocA family oxidoreductase [bacterium]|nr:Gfo/Idh/MocA family oxidoreductase [bacterium]
MKKIYYLFDENYPVSCLAKTELEQIFLKDGRFSIQSGTDVFSKNYDAVIIFKKNPSPQEERKLETYIDAGGNVLFISKSIQSDLAKKLCKIRVGKETGIQQFNVFIEKVDHYITQRFPSEFQLTDNLMETDCSEFDAFFSTLIGRKKMPVVFTKDYGKGKVSGILAGDTAQTWKDFNFRKIVVRTVAWMLGEKQKEKIINCGLVGYGPMFGMGKGHGNAINSTPGMKTIAVCDTNPERVEAAKQEMPGLAGYFTNLEEMLKLKEMDLIVGIVPHDVHYDVVMKGLEHGKHVIIEKPFCITVDEANKMIEAAQKKKLMLSVFHNRRWDGDYVVLKNLIESGLIGDIFHIECFIGNYKHPGYWWRSDKKTSGGVMHDWGAHFIDWILNLVPSKIISIYGDFQKRLWFSVTNQDHGHAIIKFENGVLADFIISSIAAINKPKWKIFGTKGAIEVNWESADRINYVSFVSGIRCEGFVRSQQSTGWVEYYRNIADHLLMGEELICKPEQSRRVIGIIEAAEKASKENRVIEPFENCE